MHPFHTYIAASLVEKIRDRHVVVWYDSRAEFRPFIDELRGLADLAAFSNGQIEMVHIQMLPTALTCYAGSFFAVRFAVEPLVAADDPSPLLIYIPGVSSDERRSPMLELEKGGTTYEPQLKRLARNVLRQFHTDGIIDELLASDRLSYHDIVQLVENATNTGKQASVLKLVFPQARDNAALIAAWLATPSSDDMIDEKVATVELYKLIGSRLGLALDQSVRLTEARGRLLRYLLVGEFRSDLTGPVPVSVSMIAAAASKEQLSFLRDVIAVLRSTYPTCYIAHADRIETELSLANADIDALQLGTIDTFRFEERALLTRCDAILTRSQYNHALQLAADRSRNFWVDRDSLRQAQWHVCRLIAELGLGCETVRAELERASAKPADWLNAYACEGGWYRIDQLQRQLESWVADMDDEPVLAQALAHVRQLHDRLAQRMADGFTKALRAARWQVEGVRSQTQIFSQLVGSHIGSGPVAYILVDALRFEMGQELAQQLAPLGELTCTPAIAALPSITKVGMAALLPGAASSFNVVEDRGKLAVRIDDAVLPELPNRQKFLKARVPQMVDLELGELLGLSQKKLSTQIKEAALVVVRSQEIDSLGESGSTLLARQIMDTMIGNVARAVRKLAGAGVTQIIATADHGHLFALERGDDMKTENPGGQQVELHRRCWVGRGGSTPPGAVRINGAELGYATDLDFIFPTGLGVFKASGGLVYHHGGLSLQELVVPVIQLRVPRKIVPQTTDATVIIGQVPNGLHTRTLGITLTLTGNLFTQDTPVRPILLAGSDQVGYAGMAFGGVLDRATGCVTLKPGVEVNVGMMLTRDDCVSVRIVVQHPVTDAVLGQTDDIRVELGI